MFPNDLNPGGNGGMCGGKDWSLWSPKLFLSCFEIEYFLGGNVDSDFIFIFSTEGFNLANGFLKRNVFTLKPEFYILLIWKGY